MKQKGYIYTLVFIFIVSAVFTALLAAANEYYRPVVERNEALAVKEAILYALNIDAVRTRADIEQFFERRIKSRTVSDMEVFVLYDEGGGTLGYAVPFSGAGLWGTIRGYMGVSSDFHTMLGVAFTQQSETPGLGGRIDEDWFKEQFRGLPVGGGNTLAYGSAGSRKIDAVTGATVTSTSVLKILNHTIGERLAELEVAD